MDNARRQQEGMSSRERVVRVLNGESVDRMPIDLGGCRSSGISAFAYHNLRKHLGLSTDNIEIIDMVQFLARVDEDILERFRCDCMVLDADSEKTRRWNVRGDYEFVIPAAVRPQKNESGGWVVEQRQADGSSERMRMPEGGYFFDGAWLSRWFEGDEDQEIAALAKEAERIYKETEYACIYEGGYSAYFGDMERVCRMLTEPEKVIAENEKLCRGYVRHAGKAIEAMGKYIQMIEICDDMGMQSELMCSPETIERCCGPFIKKFCDFVHRHSDCKVFMHNCGSIREIIPMLIEWGVDVLNPIQISAGGMEPRELKAGFGDKIIFWGGGCDTQNVLGVKSPEEVGENVRELVGIFKESGGYVFNQVHNIMGDVPAGNIVALFDAAYEKCFY